MTTAPAATTAPVSAANRRRRTATLPDGRVYYPSTSDHARSLEPSRVAKTVTWVVMVLFRGATVLSGTVMVGLLLPISLLTIPLYIVMHTLGLTDTIWSIIIPSCVSPFGVFLGTMYASSSVPDELLEAARIDGAGEFRIFFTMVLRLLAPAMVTIFLFIFVATWNNFLLPLMMVTTNTSLKPVTLGLYGMMSYFDPVYGAVLQGALFGVLPLIVLFLFLQRFWQAGLAAGAVKG